MLDFYTPHQYGPRREDMLLHHQKSDPNNFFNKAEKENRNQYLPISHVNDRTRKQFQAVRFAGDLQVIAISDNMPVPRSQTGSLPIKKEPVQELITSNKEGTCSRTDKVG